MPEDAYAPAGSLDLVQAVELSLLVDLEARWENLRKLNLGHSLQDLKARQKAYDAFHAKLVAYNRRYTPTHVTELLLNTPIRLALWCRRMRDLYRQVEHIPQSPYPVHLLEKAYCCLLLCRPPGHPSPHGPREPPRSAAGHEPRHGWGPGGVGSVVRCPWLASPQSAERVLALTRPFRYDPLLHPGHGNRA
jgi:hypothetical protein